MSAMLRIAKMPHRARDTVSHLVIAGLDPSILFERLFAKMDGYAGQARV
jgi:hypothetical protein